MTSIRDLLGDDGLTLRVPEISPPRVSDGLARKKCDIDGSKAFQVLGQALTVDGGLEASVEVHAVDAPVTVGDRPYKPAPGQAFTDLTLSGTAEVNGDGTQTLGDGITLGFSAKSHADITYRHLRSAEPSEKIGDALIELTTTSRLPHLLNPTRLETGELQSLEAHLAVDLGLSAQYGYAAGFQRDLFGSSRVPFTAEVKAALNASLGFGMVGAYTFTLERCMSQGIERQDWVRAVVSRRTENTLSLAAKLDLEVTYDLGSGLVGLMNEVLDTQPAKTLFEAMNTVKEDLASVASGDWAELVQNKLSARATAVLEAYLSDKVDSLLDAIDTPGVRDLLSKTQKALAFYNTLDTRIRSLWDRVLGYAQIGQGSSFYTAVSTLAALDPEDAEGALSDLLGGEDSGLETLLEIFAGKSLEELVLSSIPDLEAVFAEAVHLAGQVQTLIDDTDEKVIQQVQVLAENSGIVAVADWLNENLDENGTFEDFQKRLRDEAGLLVQKGIEKLVGRAWDKIPPSFLEDLQETAADLVGYLDNLDDEREKLKEVLLTLKGDIGLSLGLEWERIIARTALVDFSFDPDDRDNLDAFDNLRKGNIRGFLAALPDEDDDNTPDYMLNDCMLTETRTNTMAYNLGLAALGSLKVSNRRQVGAVRRVREVDGQLVRTGAYTASYTRIIEEENQTWQASVTVTADGHADDTDPDAAYAAVARQVSLTMGRNDNRTERSELEGTLALLESLGFTDASESINLAAIPEGAATRLAVHLALGEEALAALLADIDTTARRLAYLNAGYHWHDTELARRLGGKYVGPYLARFMESKAYRDNWLKPPQILNRLPISFQDPAHKGGVIRLKTVFAWPSLEGVPRALKRSDDELEEAREALAAADQPNHDQLIELMETVSRYFKAASAKKDWTSPMFPFFLPLCLLGQSLPALLAEVKGTASFRWKKDGEWQEPVLLGFRDGVHWVQPITET